MLLIIILYTTEVKAKEFFINQKKDTTTNTAILIAGVGVGVSGIYREGYSYWLMRSYGLSQNSWNSSLDTNVDFFFKTTNAVYIGGEFGFMFDAIPIKNPLLIRNRDALIKSYYFLPSVSVLFTTSQGFTNRIGWVATGSAGVVIALLDDYNSNLHYRYGGTLQFKIGIESEFLGDFRVALLVGSRVAIIESYPQLSFSEDYLIAIFCKICIYMTFK